MQLPALIWPIHWPPPTLRCDGTHLPCKSLLRLLSATKCVPTGPCGPLPAKTSSIHDVFICLTGWQYPAKRIPNLIPPPDAPWGPSIACRTPRNSPLLMLWRSWAGAWCLAIERRWPSPSGIALGTLSVHCHECGARGAATDRRVVLAGEGGQGVGTVASTQQTTGLLIDTVCV